MQYTYATDAANATEQLVATLRLLLNDNKKVLWLVSGGSGAKVTVNVAKQLQGIPLNNLSVTLSDERYGDVGHADENWQQLLNDGFDLPSATLYRPLIGKDRETTTERFGEWIDAAKAEVDYTIGLFGIGPDGHTAGIKPGSAAAIATTTTSDYTGEDFERITVTPVFIETIDEAITQAFGEDKHPVIAQLLHEELPILAQPAQILKTVPKSTLYSNYKENES